MPTTYATTTGDAAGLGVMILTIWGFALLIAVVIALVTANIMGKKGYSKGLGFVLGLFGGLLGLIVALVLDDKSQRRYPTYAPGYPARPQVAATEYRPQYPPQTQYFDEFPPRQ